MTNLIYNSRQRLLNLRSAGKSDPCNSLSNSPATLGHSSATVINGRSLFVFCSRLVSFSDRRKMQNCRMLLDPIVKCPYDNHFIVKSRIQKHIVKCERRFPEHYKIMCPYNANHRLFKEELATHIVTCPERNVLQSETYPEPRRHGMINFDWHSDISSTIDCTENWDLEDNDNFTIASENASSVVTNAETLDVIVDPTAAELETANEEHKRIRAPRGFSEAMLTEVNEDSCIEDEESIISSMGIGRGRVTWNANKLKFIGLGRGRSLKM